jgi:hypothetical protein
VRRYNVTAVKDGKIGTMYNATQPKQWVVDSLSPELAIRKVMKEYFNLNDMRFEAYESIVDNLKQ